MVLERMSKEYHIPGAKYAGPGTHVISRILSHDYPLDQADAAALIHDIEYLTYSNVDATPFDITAIRQSGNSLKGFLVKMGLLARIYSGIPFNSEVVNGYQIGQGLRHYISTNLAWKKALQDFNLSWTTEYVSTPDQIPYEEALSTWTIVDKN